MTGDNEPSMGPIGQMTRYAMSIAGLDRRRTKNKVAAIVGIIMAVLLVGTIGLDLAGVYTIPGMGMFYDMTGLQDPDATRVVQRVQNKLHEHNLSAKERTALRAKLLGAQRRAKQVANSRVAKDTHALTTTGVKESHTLKASDRSVAAELFANDEKKEVHLALARPEQMQTPNLPDGLTRDAIYKVINSNARSMSLCIAQAARKGEMLSGRIELSITIAATGRVTTATTETPRFRGSVIADCAVGRSRSWKFPRFNGSPVTVVYPFILGAAF